MRTVYALAPPYMARNLKSLEENRMAAKKKAKKKR
jgi:hypothetical protein